MLLLWQTYVSAVLRATIVAKSWFDASLDRFAPSREIALQLTMDRCVPLFADLLSYVLHCAYSHETLRDYINRLLLFFCIQVLCVNVKFVFIVCLKGMLCASHVD